MPDVTKLDFAEALRIIRKMLDEIGEHGYVLAETVDEVADWEGQFPKPDPTDIKIGYVACWKEGQCSNPVHADVIGNCRKPKGHDGNCAYY